MSKSGSKKTPSSTLRAFIVAFILLAVAGLALFGCSQLLAWQQEAEQETLKARLAEEMARNDEKIRTLAEERFSESIHRNVRLMTSALEHLVSDGDYTGQRVFPNGFVAEIRGETVLLPESMNEAEAAVSAELIRSSLLSGKMMTGRFENAAGEAFCLSFGEIAENWIYAHITPEGEYLTYLSLYDLSEPDTAGASEQIAKEPGRVSMGIPFATYTFLEIAIICLAMLIPFAGIIVYLCALRRRLQSGQIPEAEREEYGLQAMRSRLFYAGLCSVILVFVVAMLAHGITSLYLALQNEAADAMTALSEQIIKGEDEADAQAIAHAHENWYVTYGEQIADLISADPTLATKESLHAFSDAIGADFITLFDQDGRETLCSLDYTGFTLSQGMGENGAEFKRLLMGIPSLVHSVSTDPDTGLERQMIGVTLPPSDQSPERGALVLALLPDTIPAAVPYRSMNEQLAGMSAGNNICFIASQESGEIRFAGDETLIGKTITECGLPEESLKDGYINFATLNSELCLLMTARLETAVFYSALDADQATKPVLIYAGVAALLFAVFMLYLTAYLLRGWTNAAQAADKPQLSGEEPSSGRNRGKLYAAWQMLLKFIGWQDGSPETQARIVCRICVLLIIITWAALLSQKGMRFGNSLSLGNYLLKGDWAKGVNLFSINGILIVVTIAYLVNLLARLLFLIVSGFLKSTGRTVCTLGRSAVKYLAILVSMYFVLIDIGVPIGPVIGSLGIVSIALSLGAQSLAADIIAGLFLLFEGSIHVGDIVQIDGTVGTVKEIGIRSTVLMIDGKNVKTVNNHLIGTMVNLSREPSVYTLEFKVPRSITLERMEALLQKELPQISQRCDLLIGELKYNGISGFETPSGDHATPVPTIRITAQCLQSDYGSVRRFVDREICLLMEKESAV